ncbi:MAG: YrhK family protein [Pseudomonadota bacterium]
MRLFHPDTRSRTERHKHLYALCEIAYTFVDFLAAVLFVIGSVLFFSEATTYLGTWLFLVGSVLFGMRPTIKLWR